MASESAFEKLHVEEKEKANLSGVLEELNLPPVIVQFVRRNQRAVYAVLIIIVIGVVTWSLYGSYQEKKVNKSSSALAVAKKEPLSIQPAALQKVVDDFGGTKASLWAKIELAHGDMKNKNFSQAHERYTDVRGNIKKSSALYPLLTFGAAQASEMDDKFAEAHVEYTSLKAFSGYEGVGYSGIARTLEAQGDINGALAVYEEYLATFTGENLQNPERLLVLEKITYLKSK